MSEYENALMQLYSPQIRSGYSAADLSGLQGLQGSQLPIGAETWRRLMDQIGVNGLQGPGGVSESGAPLDTYYTLDPAALNGYTFDFARNGGYGNSGTATVTGPDGRTYSVDQQDTPTSQSVMEAAALAAAGFGGLGALTGLGPLGGLQSSLFGIDAGAGSSAAAVGGEGGAGVMSGLTPGISVPSSAMEASIAASPALAPGAVASSVGATIPGGAGSAFMASPVGAKIAGALNPLLAPIGGLKGLGEVVNTAAPLIGAWSQNRAANQAVQSQMMADQQANAFRERIWGPALQTRDSALGQINALLQNPSSITQQPGYQFGLSQGVKAMDQSAASRGMRLSGQQAKALNQFGQDYGGTKLDQSVNRLLQVANVGNMGTGSLNAQADSTSNQGALQGAVGINKAGNWTDAFNQIGAYGNKKGWWQS